MLINLTVWSNCIILYSFQGEFSKAFSLSTIFSLIAIASICIVGWLQIKTLLKASEEGKQLKIRLSNLMNPEKFQKLLSTETHIKEMISNEIALHNQITSEKHLMIVTNPNCRNCAKIHAYIKEIDSSISVSLVLLTFPNDKVGEKVAKAIIATYRTDGWRESMKELTKWYETHKTDDIEKFTITDEEQKIWEQQQIYCLQQHINRTPSMIVDRYYVPEFYQLKELKYVLT